MSVKFSDGQAENLAEQWNLMERIRVIKESQREAQIAARSELGSLSKKLAELQAEYRSGCFQAVMNLGD